MSSERAPLFGKPNLDLSKFAPKEPAAAKDVREMAERSGFPSREPTPVTSSEQELSEKEQRRYRTGRNVAFSLKVRQQDLDRFYRLAKQEGVVMGEAFARALDAWEEMLTSKS